MPRPHHLNGLSQLEDLHKTIRSPLSPLATSSTIPPENGPSPLSPMSTSMAYGVGSDLLVGEESYLDHIAEAKELSKVKKLEEHNQQEHYYHHPPITPISKRSSNKKKNIIALSSPRVQSIMYTSSGDEAIFNELIHTLMGSETNNDNCKDWETAVDLIYACPKIAKIRGEWNRYALHYACSNQAPIFVVEALLDAYPKAARKRCTWRNGGWLPLHCSAACNANEDVIDLLLTSNPDTATAKDDDDRLPLHLACLFQLPTDSIDRLIREHPHSVREFDADGYLPIHCALETHSITLLPMWSTVRLMLTSNSEKSCKIKLNNGMRALSMAARKRAPVDILQTMIAAYPRAIRKPDNRGRTPLHWACVYGDHVSPPQLAIVQLFLEKYLHAAREIDDHGLYPLFHAYDYGELLPNNVDECLVEAYPMASEIYRGMEGTRDLVEAMGGVNHNGEPDWVLANQLIVDHEDVLHRKGPWGRTVVHFAAAAAAPPFFIKKILKLLPSAINVKDRSGCIPILLAAANTKTHVDVLKYLLNAYPEGIQARTNVQGYLPLHLACKNRAPYANISLLLDAFPAAAGLKGKIVFFFYLFFIIIKMGKVINLFFFSFLFFLFSSFFFLLSAHRPVWGTLPLQLSLAKYHKPVEENQTDGRKINTVGIPENLRNTIHLDKNQRNVEKHKAVVETETEIKLHGEPPMWNVISILLHAYPAAAKEVDTSDGMLPLHVASRMHAPFKLMQDLLLAFKNGTRVEDRRGKLPLYYALQTKATMKNINALFEAYPKSADLYSKELGYEIIKWQAVQPGTIC